MKKVLLFLSAGLFAGLVFLSVLAFTDDDPKKKSTEASTTQCEQHQKNCTEATAGEAKKEGACCKEGGEKCKEHAEAKAEVK